MRVSPGGQTVTDEAEYVMVTVVLSFVNPFRQPAGTEMVDSD